MNKDLFNFSVQIYGDLKQRTETTSMARCRIFYKGLNFNGGFISDEFAEKLLNTLPYTPIKGIYNLEEKDFTDHGKSRTEGRIYGIVPENPNVTWEEHLDDDGVTRNYACCDVLLYTALYEEASKIIGKAESMELYPPSIAGFYTRVNGVKAYQYTSGCFFGLQVLGDSVCPCFEGAAFFTLNDKVEQALQKLTELESTFTVNNIGGNAEMCKLNFKLPEGNEMYQSLFSLLNPNFTEEGNWEVEKMILYVGDDFVFVKNYDTNAYEKISFTAEEAICDKCGLPLSQCTCDENCSACGEKKSECSCEKKKNYTLNDSTTFSMIEVSESEEKSLNSVKELNGNSFEKIEETFSKITELENKIVDFEAVINQKETELLETKNNFATLQLDKENLENLFSAKEEELTNANEKISQLNQENEALKNYRASVERASKQALIDKYSQRLNMDIISKYSANTELSIEELEKQLAVELVQNTPALFTKDGSIDVYIPQDVPPTGIEAILDKYQK